MRIFRLFCVLFLLMCASVTWTPAQQSFSTGAKELLQSIGGADSKNLYGVSIQLDETALKIDSSNRVVSRQHRIYRIDSPEAVESWSTVEAQWAPWHQKRPTIRARVITPDGAEHLLDMKTLSDAPAHDSRPEVFGDEREYSGPLPAVKVGSIVETEITIEDAEPFFAAGTVRRFLFGQSAPIAKRRVTVESPKSLPLKYTARLLPQLSVSREELKGNVRLIMEQTSLPAIDIVEPDLPSDISPWPYVVVSTAPSWQAIATNYNQLVEKKIVSADLKTIAAKYKGADRMETIQNLVAYLHSEVRYTGVEFGEATLVPRKPEETLKEKYGDCKDKAAALVALFRAGGIEAHLALLSSGPGLDIDPEHPGMGMFDHAIVYAPGTPEVWIDATDEFSIAGLPYMDQGRMALVISSDSNQLHKTPEAKSEDNLLVEYRQFELPEFGPAKITEISEPHGSAEAYYRSEFGGGDSKELLQEMEQYVKAEYLADSLTKFERGKGSDLKTPFKMELVVAKGKRGATDLESAVVAIRFESLLSHFPEYIRSGSDDADKDENNTAALAKKKPRTADVVFEPFITEWRYKVMTPPGFRVRSLPANRSLDIGPARMAQKFEAGKDGAVNAIIRIDSVRGRYTASEALAARKAIHDVQKSDALIINFEQKGAAELASGNVREALASYRDLAAQYPTKALHRIRLARALLGAGLGEQSREEVREAIKLEPQSAIAHRELGRILQHDLIGRKLKKGFDLQGAIAEYRKAKELDPQNADILAELAILLEHDEAGERYTSKAKLDEAITAYREIEKIDKNVALYYVDNILFDLIYSRQFKAANEMLANLPQTQQRLAFELAVIAAVDGPAAALKRSSEIARESKNRQPALKMASGILRNMRMYPASAEFSAAAAEGDANAAQVLGQVQAFRNTKPYDQVLKTDDPRNAVQRFFVYIFNPAAIDGDPTREFEFLAPVSTRGKAESLSKQAAKVRTTFERLKLPYIVAADLVISNMQMGVEGDDQRGYRIHVQGLGAETTKAFVARVEGNYRIMGFEEEIAGIGVEILRQIQAGNLAAAKQWLDWAREEIVPPSGDDFFSWPVFPRLWKRGDPADPAKMRIAALAIIANTEYVKPYLSELKDAANHALSNDKVSAQTMMVAAYEVLEQWPEMKELSWQMLQAQPTSEYAFNAVTNSAGMMHDWKTSEKAIALRLEKLPEDHMALSYKARLFSKQGNIKEARAILKGLIDSGRATAQDMNSYGWDALFTDKVEIADIEIVQRASGKTQNASYSIVHTLACLYAEVGKTKEAHELLMNAISLSGLDEPDPPVWYGLGRLAEQYGERAASLAAYKRVTNPEGEQDSPVSCWTLAQKRIRALGAAAGAVTSKGSK
jgi:transglutaminase-like putative cysteine protease/predicted Zn-dependent protease